MSVSSSTNFYVCVYIFVFAQGKKEEEEEEDGNDKTEERRERNDLPSPSTQKQTSPGHILRRPNPSQRIRLGELVPDRIEHRLHHLGREGPACEGIHRDAPGAQGDGQGPRELVETGLAGAVGVVLQMGDAEGVDGPYVDDPRTSTTSTTAAARGSSSSSSYCRLFQNRGEELGQGEDALEVEGQELGPGVVRVCVEGLAPGGARVVDKDVEAWAGGTAELGGEFCGEGFAGVEGLEVGREGEG